MKQLFRKIPFYLPLIAVFFCLHGGVENFGYISVAETLHVFWQVMICMFIVFLLILLKSRSILYAGIVCFLLSGIYLFFGTLKAAFSHIGFLRSYSVMLPLLLVIVTTLMILFWKKQYLLQKITLFLNLLFIAYCLFDAGLVLIRATAAPEKNIPAVAFNSAAVKNKPDIYFLLFDEYAGYQSLRDSMDFKNDLFYDQLRSDSFALLPISSNYSITPFSMASIFNMDYVKDIKDSSAIGWRQTQERSKEIKRGEVFNIFTKMGYAVKSFSLFEVMQNKSTGGNQYLLGHERVLTNKLFHNVIMKDLGWRLAVGKYAIPKVQELELGDMPQYNGRVEAGLISSLKKESAPQFIYCHFLMPHAPFLFDSTGRAATTASLFEGEPWANKKLYVSYLKYCNRKIMEYEQAITKFNPDAMIILMSDHGFRDFKLNLPVSAFDNFCAVRYLPQKPVALTGISNVNFFRWLFNQYFGQQIPYLPDQKVFLREIP